jgi:hypothetical protein
MPNGGAIRRNLTSEAQNTRAELIRRREEEARRNVQQARRCGGCRGRQIRS